MSILVCVNTLFINYSPCRTNINGKELFDVLFLLMFSLITLLPVGEKLELFLRSLNSSKPLYLGQTGLGTTEELGKLALEPGENFCMGGPGMIFSREVLRRMVPHIGSCLREMYTTHEDVEIGRCVRRFGGTQCVWSYEVTSSCGIWVERVKVHTLRVCSVQICLNLLLYLLFCFK